MSEAMRHVLPYLDGLPRAAVLAYLLATSTGSLAAGVVVGWVWGRR